MSEPFVSDDERNWILDGIEVNSTTVVTSVPRNKLRELFDAKYERDRLLAKNKAIIGLLTEATKRSRYSWSSGPIYKDNDMENERAMWFAGKILMEVDKIMKGEDPAS